MQNFTLQPQIFARVDVFYRKYIMGVNITDLTSYDFVEIPHQTCIDKRSERNSHKSFEVHVLAIYIFGILIFIYFVNIFIFIILIYFYYI